MILLTVDGQNPAPIDRSFVFVFTGFVCISAGAGFHQQYHSISRISDCSSCVGQHSTDFFHQVTKTIAESLNLFAQGAKHVFDLNISIFVRPAESMAGHDLATVAMKREGKAILASTVEGHLVTAFLNADPRILRRGLV